MTWKNVKNNKISRYLQSMCTAFYICVSDTQSPSDQLKLLKKKIIVKKCPNSWWDYKQFLSDCIVI